MTIPVFALNGDKTTVPTAAQTDGSVSWDAGFPIAYEGNLASDPSARNIERGKFNKILFDITTAVKSLTDADPLPKTNGVATNLTLAANATTAMGATTLQQLQTAIAAIPAPVTPTTTTTLAITGANLVMTVNGVSASLPVSQVAPWVINNIDCATLTAKLNSCGFNAGVGVAVSPCVGPGV